jgi:hypothetical protein
MSIQDRRQLDKTIAAVQLLLPESAQRSGPVEHDERLSSPARSEGAVDVFAPDPFDLSLERGTLIPGAFSSWCSRLSAGHCSVARRASRLPGQEPGSPFRQRGPYGSDMSAITRAHGLCWCRTSCQRLPALRYRDVMTA